MAERAVVLDLDGTLVDTAPDLLGATNHVLAAHGRRPVALDEIRPMVGQGARQMIRRGFAATGAPVREDRLEGLYGAFIEYYQDHMADRSRPFPGAVRLLDRCRHAGIRLAVCTNKLEHLSNTLLNALDLAGYFSAVVGADSVAAPKPDPAPYIEAVKRAGGAVGSSLMIGDSGTDIRLARAAGVPVIAVSFGYSEPPVAEFGPDHLVDHFDQVWPLVEARLPAKAAATGSGLETA